MSSESSDLGFTLLTFFFFYIKHWLQLKRLSLIDTGFLSVLFYPDQADVIHTRTLYFWLYGNFNNTLRCPTATRLAETGAAGSKSLVSDWRSLSLCVQQLLLSAAVFRMVVLNDCGDGQGFDSCDWLRLGFLVPSTWSLIGWCSLCARGVSAAAFWMVLRLRSRRRPWAKGVRMVLVHVGYLVLPVFGSVRSRGIVMFFL